MQLVINKKLKLKLNLLKRFKGLNPKSPESLTKTNLILIGEKLLKKFDNDNIEFDEYTRINNHCRMIRKFFDRRIPTDFNLSLTKFDTECRPGMSSDHIKNNYIYLVEYFVEYLVKNIERLKAAA